MMLRLPLVLALLAAGTGFAAEKPLRVGETLTLHLDE